VSSFPSALGSLDSTQCTSFQRWTSSKFSNLLSGNFTFSILQGEYYQSGLHIDKENYWNFFDGACKGQSKLCGIGGVLYLLDTYYITFKENYAEVLTIKRNY
jgi:hypothetical protein